MNVKSLDKLMEGEIDMALKRRAKKVLLGINSKKKDVILDAACGPGYYLNLLDMVGKNNLSLFGIDINKDSISNAKKRFKGKGIKLVVGDVVDMPFGNNTFDKVIASELFEHLKDENKALEEIYRVLKPGGQIVLTVPNHNYPFFWDPINWILERFSGKHIDEGPWSGLWANHLRLYKPNDIITIVKRNGFKIMESSSLTRWCIPFNHNLLYGGRLSPKASKNILLKAQSSKKPAVIRIILSILNTFDKLNDIFPSNNIGVGVYVRARK